MVGAIVFQIKNDRRFGHGHIDGTLFSFMDPYECGIFTKDVFDPPPVIRIVGIVREGIALETGQLVETLFKVFKPEGLLPVG